MDLTKYYPDIAAKYPAYVTQRELCEICHICPKTAYNLEQQGEIPYTIEQNPLIRSHKIKLTDILAYLKMTGIPYAPIYGDIVESRKKNGTPILKTTGVSRSGCMYCMYGVHLEHEPNRFQLMQVTHPQQYDYCINKLGCGAVLDYIGVPYRNQQLEVDHC